VEFSSRHKRINKALHNFEILGLGDFIIMSMLCSTHNEVMEPVNMEKFENGVPITVYLCPYGHKLVTVECFDKASIRELPLRIKARNPNRKGKKIWLESKIEGEIEKRFLKRPSGAIQLILAKNKILHIHCKSKKCENKWGMKEIRDGIPLDQKFSITQNQEGKQIITCKRCKRQYF
jgi:hypothetical protein